MSVRDRPALLVLETGEVYEGQGWGRGAVAVGEVVFNTSMTGYQEVLTDPSYAGQLVAMTYPHIGNYGVNPVDVESDAVQPAGFIVRDLSRRPSNYRSRASLERYLERSGVTAIAGVDTRALTRRIRSGGAVMGLIAHGVGREDASDLVERLRAEPRYDAIDHVSRVTGETVRRVVVAEPSGEPTSPALAFETLEGAGPADLDRHLVVMDFGAKYSILRRSIGRGFDVTLVPSWTTAAEVMALRPKGVLLSNGPGDPARLGAIVEEVGRLLGRVPVYGICLGHQLLAMSLGATTFKLKFGHRGVNQPVLDRASGRVAITSQNHGYAVDPARLPGDVEVTQVNLNDGTVEGIRHRELAVEGVQYHPEAGPGPRDAARFFDAMATALLGGGR